MNFKTCTLDKLFELTISYSGIQIDVQVEAYSASLRDPCPFTIYLKGFGACRLERPLYDYQSWCLAEPSPYEDKHWIIPPNDLILLMGKAIEEYYGNKATTCYVNLRRQKE